MWLSGFIEKFNFQIPNENDSITKFRNYKELPNNYNIFSDII